MAPRKILGTALLAALPLMALGAKPDCKKLYGGDWTGGVVTAKQGETEYKWSFSPCTPEPVAKCHVPPYSGPVYIAQINEEPIPNKCFHELFCPDYQQVYKSGSDVIYQLPSCVPSQTGVGPSPRSANITVSCDSPTLKLDPVLATRWRGGYHFDLHFHAPCHNPQPPLSPPPTPLPGQCELLFGSTDTDFFTLPLNTSGRVHGQVFDWGFNLCNKVEYNGNTGYFLNMNAKTREITNLDVIDGAGVAPNSYKFRYSSTHNSDTAVVRVYNSNNYCVYLSPPTEGVIATINEKGGLEYSLSVYCNSN